MKTGGGLGYALAQSKRFPKLALQMISVGEESGELDTMLMKVADTFDVEVKNTLDRLLAALVPATTIVMTVVVAMIMLAIVLPIMNIAGEQHPVIGSRGSSMTQRRTRLPRARGFSLIEMLAVIVLIGIVAGIVVQQVGKNVDKGKWGAGKAQVQALAGRSKAMRSTTARRPRVWKT